MGIAMQTGKIKLVFYIFLDISHNYLLFLLK